MCKHHTIINDYCTGFDGENEIDEGFCLECGKYVEWTEQWKVTKENPSERWEIMKRGVEPCLP